MDLVMPGLEVTKSRCALGYERHSCKMSCSTLRLSQNGRSPKGPRSDKQVVICEGAGAKAS
eukprot:1078369-Amphidinium_carterae.1